MLHQLTVSQIRRETANAVSLVFDIPQGLAARFAFTPGQYLTLEAAIHGEQLRRPYSICSGLDDHEIRVAVKEVAGGRFSSFINRDLKVGDVLGVMEPKGRFGLAPVPESGRIILAVVAGSGVTPIFSIARTVLAREPRSQFLLVCANRRREDIIFGAEIERLKQFYSPRLIVHHVFSREYSELEQFRGRVDGEMLAAILKEAGVPGSVINDALLCGPPEMMVQLSAALQAMGVAPTRILTEVFSVAAAKLEPCDLWPEGDAVTRQVEIRLGGRGTSIDVRPGETIVGAARRSGVEVPYSCGGGTCCSCVAKIVAGSVEAPPASALEPWEREAGFVLTCQSRPASDRLVVDYDAAF
ncbi:2Fe-2S iron-sulfur cluster-binding protein [Mesorhizobium sp. M0119]|uniref:2Fe-2S iron-sulfur cluster-binding protein n=1 Tax=Mesorhizobium sp. M0119 TaxID=2956885 RepID=UPI003338B009